MARKGTDLMTAKTARRERRRESRGMMTADELATERYGVIAERLATIEDKHLGLAEHQRTMVETLTSNLIRALVMQGVIDDPREMPAPGPARRLRAVK